MRKLQRLELHSRYRSYLRTKQEQVSAGADVERTWKSARRSKSMGAVYFRLCEIAGERSRCMFCEDSRGTDIEHFWPKLVYKELAFAWPNFLLLCSGCNRQKGVRFPLDDVGKPLLINPLDDEPWLYLVYDPPTGQITARWQAQTGFPDPRGEATTKPELLPLNVDAVVKGRQRTVRNIVRAVRQFLADVRAGETVDDAEAELLSAIVDNTDYGLAEWFFLYDGQTEEPFASLREVAPASWERIAQACGS